MTYRGSRNLDSDLLVFDIETVQHEAIELSRGEDAVAPSKQRPIVVGMADISIEYSDGDPVYRLAKIEAVAGPTHQITEQFFDQVSSRRPRLVSYNGKGFDIPCLKSAALESGIDISVYMETGTSKWDSYESHYDKMYHYDCMDVIAGRGRYPKLDHVARRLGIPSKMGIDGSKVQGLYDNGEIEAIRQYCDFDVLTTLLIFLHLQRSFHGLPEGHFKASLDSVRGYLLENAGENPHFDDYNMAWGAPAMSALSVENKVISLADKLAELEELDADIPF
jgi:predicted PolB exonuclease-like 3'-5' exonuclease